jgi:hypothetical protein
MPVLGRLLDADHIQAGGVHHPGQMHADADVASLGGEERAIGRDEVVPVGRLRHQHERVAMVVLQREQSAGLEGSREPLHMRVRIGKKEKHPAGEHQVVAVGRQIGVVEIGQEDSARPEAIAARERLEPRGKCRRTLHRVDRAAHAAP